MTPEGSDRSPLQALRFLRPLGRAAQRFVQCWRQFLPAFLGSAQNPGARRRTQIEPLRDRTPFEHLRQRTHDGGVGPRRNIGHQEPAMRLPFWDQTQHQRPSTFPLAVRARNLLRQADQGSSRRRCRPLKGLRVRFPRRRCRAQARQRNAGHQWSPPIRRRQGRGCRAHQRASGAGRQRRKPDRACRRRACRELQRGRRGCDRQSSSCRRDSGHQGSGGRALRSGMAQSPRATRLASRAGATQRKLLRYRSRRSQIGKSSYGRLSAREGNRR